MELIRYILGRAGKGKTRYIYGEIASALTANPTGKLFLLVPEQYTLQAELDLINYLQVPGLIEVEVLSLTRLAERVFEEVGGNTRTLVNEQGRQMAIRQAVEEVHSQLTIYNRASRLPGFITQCSELLSELKQNQVPPEDLLMIQDNLSNDLLLSKKLRDTSLIYQHFNQFLSERKFLDSDDYLLMLIDKMHDAGFIKGASIWVDGFTTFSPLSVKIILQLMLLSKNITISLSLDSRPLSRDQDLFQLSLQTLGKFRAYAKKQGLPEEQIEVDPKPADKHRKPEMLHLEAELMALPSHIYLDEVKALKIKVCSNVYNEIDKTAQEIIFMAREKAWRWQEMAVVCGDIDAYGTIIKRTFAEYGIPCFLDLKRSIINSPLVRFILSTVDSIQGKYRSRDIISLIKTDLTEVGRDECEILENYALRFGINGRRWKDTFTWGEADECEKAEQIRQIFIGHLLKTEKAWQKSPDCQSIIAALYENIQDQGVAERLEVMIMKQVEQGAWELAFENAQIWNIVWQIMDQLLLLAGELDLSLDEFRQLLETGFRSYELAIIPPMVDQVLIGNIGRSKSQDIKALFILGCNDGILPSTMLPEGLLSHEERGELLARGLELGWDRTSKTAEETFLIYNTFAKPEEYLVVSYPLADSAGRAMRPSLLIRQLHRIFRQLHDESDLLDVRDLDFNAVSTPGGSFKYLIKSLRADQSRLAVDNHWSEVYQWYTQQPEWTRLLNMVEDGMKYRNQAGPLPKHMLSKLYESPIHTSVSRLERFVRCPFAHFVRFGLQAQERKNYTMEPPDLGDFFHSFLHKFSLQVENQPGGWHSLDYAVCQNLSDQVLDEMIPGYGHGILESSHRYRFLAGRLKRIGQRAIWTISQELQKGSFNPVAYEVRFGSGCALPAIEVRLANGELILVEGRIDRIDMLEDSEDIYLRVLDYKTGPQDLNLSDVYYGLSLQLLVYLKAVMAGYQSESSVVQPAGIFFFHIDDPLVKSDERILEKVEALAAKELGLKGIVLDDLKIIRMMDRDFEGTSTYLPVSLNKDLSLSRHSSSLDQNGFASLLRHVDKVLGQIGQDLTEGMIKIEPVKMGNQTACQYCPYQSICQFDRKLPGNQYKNLCRLDREEVLERIEGGG